MQRFDAEGEMVVVIKDRCRNVSKEDALNHVLGYTCGNDVSARDWQQKDRRENNSDWWRAKSADTFSPMGPWIETEANPADQHLRTRVNGNEEQNESTAHLIFDVPTMIEFITRYVTLEPGGLHLYRHTRHDLGYGGRRHLRGGHQRHRHTAEPGAAGTVASGGRPCAARRSVARPAGRRRNAIVLCQSDDFQPDDGCGHTAPFRRWRRLTGGISKAGCPDGSAAAPQYAAGLPPPGIAHIMRASSDIVGIIVHEPARRRRRVVPQPRELRGRRV